MNTPSVIISQTFLNSLPKSKYRNYAYNHKDDKHSVERYDSDTTQPYSSSDETINYWTQDQPTTSQIPKTGTKTVKFWV